MFGTPSSAGPGGSHAGGVRAADRCCLPAPDAPAQTPRRCSRRATTCTCCCTTWRTPRWSSPFQASAAWHCLHAIPHAAAHRPESGCVVTGASIRGLAAVLLRGCCGCRARELGAERVGSPVGGGVCDGRVGRQGQAVGPGGARVHADAHRPHRLGESRPAPAPAPLLPLRLYGCAPSSVRPCGLSAPTLRQAASANRLLLPSTPGPMMSQRTCARESEREKRGACVCCVGVRAYCLQVWSVAFNAEGNRVASVGDDRKLVTYSCA